MKSVWLAVMFCLFPLALFGESKAEAILRTQLEAAQKATAIAQQVAATERAAREKTEATLAAAITKNAAIGTATHKEVVASVVSAKSAAEQAANQQKAATDEIIAKQEANAVSANERLAELKIRLEANPWNSPALWIAAFGSIASCITGGFAAWLATRSHNLGLTNAGTMKSLEENTNSKMDQLLQAKDDLRESTNAVARTEGIAEGKKTS
jgi:hypothetical protein